MCRLTCGRRLNGASGSGAVTHLGVQATPGCLKTSDDVEADTDETADPAEYDTIRRAGTAVLTLPQR